MKAARKIFSFPKNLSSGLLRISFFWILIISMGLCACLFAWWHINNLAEEEREKMLNSMHGRAESIIWALESGARFCRGHMRAISDLFVEMAKQPGIAWIALVNSEGRILMDSNPELSGRILYTPSEMRALATTTEATGRFSPDDPDIYETWKIFNPWRIRDSRHHEGALSRQKAYIFVGMNAMDFHNSLANYKRQMRLIGGLIILASFVAILLAFYAYKLSLSRRQLADARAFSTLVIKSYPSPMLATDSKLRINIANEAAEKLFGLHGRNNLRTLKNFDWAGSIKELGEKKQIVERKTEIKDSKGKIIPVSLTAATIRDAANHESGFIFVFRNLAEINLLKNKLRQSERLSNLGKLASGLAHEIRNPLSSICGYANYLETKLHEDPMGAGAARLLVEEAKRVNGVLTDLLNLAKPPALNRMPQALTGILEKTRLLAMPDAQNKNVRLNFNPVNTSDYGNLPVVDKDRLTQAVLNLLLNAIQAVPNGGKVDIKLDYTKEPTESQEKSFYSIAGPFWRIKISDNGPGMSEDIKNQLFTPYFTTRANGSGLGLPITREIVESHDGIIYVESTPGHGAIFTILLPAGGDK